MTTMIHENEMTAKARNSLLRTITFLAALWTTTTTGIHIGCMEIADMVVTTNTLEVLVVPEQLDMNTFTRSKLSVTFSWTHLAHLMNETCVDKFLVEFGPLKIQDPQSASLRHISKRETISSSSQISPPFPNDITTFSTELEDDCQVYYAQLLVFLRDGNTQKTLKSSRKAFWPAAHRTQIEKYTNAMVVNWPPKCAHTTEAWRLKVCKQQQNSWERSCDDDSVVMTGSPTVKLINLSQCTGYQLDVVANTGSEEVNLWTFFDARTLPVPVVHIAEETHELSISLDQNHCESPSTKVRNWFVTYCERRSSTKDPAPSYDQEGSGMAGDEDEQDYFTYYDFSADSTCINRKIQIDDENFTFSIEELRECTSYSVDLVPLDESGATLQPGEQFGAIHSTLCPDLVQEDESFWFDDDDDESMKNSSSDSGNVRQDHSKLSYEYILLVCCCVIVLLVAVTVIVVIWKRIASRRKKLDQRPAFIASGTNEKNQETLLGSNVN